jgi:predicted N-acyltransferase
MKIGGDISIRWLSSAEQLPVELWTQCFVPPLEGRWWYQTLERAALESQFTFFYGVIERDNQPVGIAPAFLMDVPIDLVAPHLFAMALRFAGRFFPSLRYKRTLFVGSPCSDEGTVGLLPRTTLAEVAPILQDSLAAKAKAAGASMVVWKDFPRSCQAALHPLCCSHSLFEVVSYPNTVVSLPKGGFEAYLAAIKSSQRNSFRKKLRRGKEAGELTTHIVQGPDEATVKEIFGLFWQTYLKGKTKFERLTPEFFQFIAQQDQSYFILMRRPQTGELAAFMLCFRMGQRVINKFVGFNYSLGKEWYLYFRLWEQAVRWASAIGATAIQSGQTNYRIKFDLGHHLVPLRLYCRHRNRLTNAFFARCTRGVDLASLDNDLEVYLNARGDKLIAAENTRLT